LEESASLCKRGKYFRLGLFSPIGSVSGMTHPNFRQEALRYHRRLTPQLWGYLEVTRGIPKSLIHRHLLGWNGERITIPIPRKDGSIAFFKLARDPEDVPAAPKMLTSPGATAELYGWDTLRRNPERVVIAEGEFDRLVLEGHGFPAVTSTAGALTFLPEWAEEIAKIPEIYVSFDRDEAGREGALKIARLLPQARIVELPEEVGDHGDVSDFLVRLKRKPEDFEALLRKATPVPAPHKESEPPPSTSPLSLPESLRERVAQAKEAVAIDRVVGLHVPLRPSGAKRIGHCPFHEDRTPSFVCFPKTKTFHCFGCGAHGDALAFLSRYLNLSFLESLETLERIASSYGDSAA
jgi:DNA primase